MKRLSKLQKEQMLRDGKAWLSKEGGCGFVYKTEDGIKFLKITKADYDHYDYILAMIEIDRNKAEREAELKYQQNKGVSK